MKILQINVFNYRKGGSEVVYFSTMELLRMHGEEVVGLISVMDVVQETILSQQETISELHQYISGSQY